MFEGRTLALEELRGKAVFLNFWASWCPPCRTEAGLLEAAWQKYRDQGVGFVGVNIQDEEESARTFIREFGITYPNGLDRGARIAIGYGVWGLPETFFIDREERITYKHVGALGWQTIVTKLEKPRRASSAPPRGAASTSRADDRRRAGVHPGGLQMTARYRRRTQAAARIAAEEEDR